MMLKFQLEGEKQNKYVNNIMPESYKCYKENMTWLDKKRQGQI